MNDCHGIYDRLNMESLLALYMWDWVPSRKLFCWFMYSKEGRILSAFSRYIVPKGFVRVTSWPLLLRGTVADISMASLDARSGAQVPAPVPEGERFALALTESCATMSHELAEES